MTTAINIVSSGARTPVGLSSAAAAAAVRAGISRLGEHPFMIDQVGDPMPAALDPRLDPGLIGPQRLLAMAETPLREACKPVAALSRWRLRVPVYLALPELRPGFAIEDARGVQAGLARLTGLPLEVSDVKIIPEGHAAGIGALGAALQDLESLAMEACLVGGVDSYFHPDTMEWLDVNRQLAGAVSRSGFVPGEGAAFCLIATDAACDRLRLTPLARIAAVATSRETKLIKTADVCLGEGLTETVRQVVRDVQSRSEKVNDIICDMNSERYRAEEWGFVCLRMPLCFDDPTGYVSPADCWGDMGAASGTLFTMLACEAAARGYSKGPRTLLWASSERGLRGAALLETDAKRSAPNVI